LALLDSFPTSGTEDVSPSQQNNHASKGYYVAPMPASLWLFYLFSNALIGYRITPPASLSLPLSH